MHALVTEMSPAPDGVTAGLLILLGFSLFSMLFGFVIGILLGFRAGRDYVAESVIGNLDDRADPPPDEIGVTRTIVYSGMPAELHAVVAKDPVPDRFFVAGFKGGWHSAQYDVRTHVVRYLSYSRLKKVIEDDPALSERIRGGTHDR